MKLSHTIRRLHLRTPFATSKGVTEDFQQVFVQLEDGDCPGTGAAVLSKEPGMAADEVTGALDALATPLAAAGLDEAHELLAKLAADFSRFPSALAAVDMALLDMAAQRAGQPAGLFLGCPRRSDRQTAVSIGDLPAGELLAAVRERAAWPILKLKLGREADPSVLGAVRAAYGGRIWVDGNCGWTPARALEIAVELKRHGVELLEQPIPPGDPAALREIRRRSGLKLIADEDLRSMADILALADCVDGVNIKLFRCGGPRPARDMIRAARAEGLAVMLGCKTESSVGVTAAAHLAGWADYLDLDGHLDVLDDPYGGLTITQGEMTLPEKNGLGLTLATSKR